MENDMYYKIGNTPPSPSTEFVKPKRQNAEFDGLKLVARCIIRSREEILCAYNYGPIGKTGGAVSV